MTCRLALGSAQLGMVYGVANRVGQPDPALARRILDRAVERGVRWIDTAPDYGESEARIGAWLASFPDRDAVHICTKLPRLESGLAPSEVRRRVAAALDASRKSLGVDCIHAYVMHAPGNLREYAGVLVDALVEHAQAGRVERLGVSVYDAVEVDGLLEYEALSVSQYPFNLFDRRVVASGAVERLKARGCLRFARSVLLQGLLALGADELDARVASAAEPLSRLGDLCRAFDWDPVDLALAYAAERCGADEVVLGVESVAQLDQAVAALGQSVPDALARAIDAAFANLPEHIVDPRRWTTA
jgi:aryl-alcohol dehydrogenase-like predicted oxidoreductase